MKNRTLLATAGLPALATDAPQPLYERIGGLQVTDTKEMPWAR